MNEKVKQLIIIFKKELNNKGEERFFSRKKNTYYKLLSMFERDELTLINIFIEYNVDKNF